MDFKFLKDISSEYLKDISEMSFTRAEALEKQKREANKQDSFEHPKRKYPVEYYLKDIEQEMKIIKLLLDFANDSKGMLLLAGNNGTGKSFAAKCIMDSLEDDYIFITQSRLNIDWNAQFQEYKDTTYLLNKYLNCTGLVLDDIGTRTPSEAFMDFIYSIVDHRYNSDCSTIITTNLNSIDMSAKFGSAFTSRVASGIVIRFEGKDRRLCHF